MGKVSRHKSEMMETANQIAKTDMISIHDKIKSKQKSDSMSKEFRNKV